MGHPDKLCDRISDAVLDEALEADRNARVAVETLATDGKIVIAGEITCSRRLNVRVIARKVLADVGYDPDEYTISVFLHSQSEDIAGGVSNALETRNGKEHGNDQGAGDQGTVYGYATNECSSFIPMPLELSHRICRRLDEARRYGLIRGIGPDGKAQVSVEYDDGRPMRVTAVVISVQHDEDKTQEELRDDIFTHVIPEAFSIFPLEKDTPVYINPSGRFVKGGPSADTGLTGRKLMVDTYGGLAPHGGGAFSGKDPSKVDRSGAYAARHIAKAVVLAGLADRCTVSISYAIGKAEPVALYVDTHGTGLYPDDVIAAAARKIFPLKPRDIIGFFRLRYTYYRPLSAYGHFSDPLAPWEMVRDEHAERLLKETENAGKGN